MPTDPVIAADPAVPAVPAGGDPAAPAAPAVPAGGGSTSYSYPEDRSNWVAPSRLSAAERATNLATRETQRLEAELAAERRRVQALAGVAPTDPSAEDIERTKEAFFVMFPEARRLFAADPDRLERILANGDQAEHVVQSHWDHHRDQTFADLTGRVAVAMGLEGLNKTQSAKVIAAFKDSIPNPRADPDGYARFTQRYEQRDPTLLTEFVTEFVGDFITPAQRAGYVRRGPGPVPSGGASRPMTTNQNQKPDYSKMSVPEMLAHAEEQADAHYGG